MSDNEIIKALECHVGKMDCDSCPYGAEHGVYCIKVLHRHSLEVITRQKAEIERLENDLEETADRLGVLLWHATDGMLSKSNYTTEVMVSALNDHIQKCCEEAESEANEEIARLQAEKDNLIRTYKECALEVVKEFAERLKAVAEYDDVCEEYSLHPSDIDNLIKEMVGERE